MTRKTDQILFSIWSIDRQLAKKWIWLRIRRIYGSSRQQGTPPTRVCGLNPSLQDERRRLSSRLCQNLKEEVRLLRQVLADLDDNATMVSVSGVRAYDLTSRNVMLRGLPSMVEGRRTIPFARAFCGSPSSYFLEDEVGATHIIAQRAMRRSRWAIDCRRRFAMDSMQFWQQVAKELREDENLFANLDDIWSGVWTLSHSKIESEMHNFGVLWTSCEVPTASTREEKQIAKMWFPIDPTGTTSTETASTGTASTRTASTKTKNVPPLLTHPDGPATISKFGDDFDTIENTPR